MIHRIQFEQLVPDSIEKVFRFFADPNDLPRIVPPKTGTELTALRLLPPPTAAEFPIVNRLLARARRLQPPFACCPFFLSAQNGSPQLPNSNGTPLRRYTEKRTVQTISASPRVAKHAKVVPSRVCLLTFENPLFEVAGESEPPSRVWLGKEACDPQVTTLLAPWELDLWAGAILVTRVAG